MFADLLKEHGLKHIRLHDLRHSCASNMLASGVPMKEIQEWLGHSNFSTTVNNQYGHTKSKLELKQSNQCKSKSRDSLRNLDFLSTYLEC